MPYHLVLHTPDTLYASLQGSIEIETATALVQDIWQMLDDCFNPTRILLDGRGSQINSCVARFCVEHIIQHIHLGRIALVMSQDYMHLFAPLVHLVPNIGIFENKRDALLFLQAVDRTQFVPQSDQADLLERSVGSMPMRTARSFSSRFVQQYDHASDAVSPAAQPASTVQTSGLLTRMIEKITDSSPQSMDIPTFVRLPETGS